MRTALDAGAPGTLHVGRRVVADVDGLVRPDVEQLEGVLEDGRMGLLVAHPGADAEDLEVARQLERLQQLGCRPAPVAHDGEPQPGRLHAHRGPG